MADGGEEILREATVPEGTMTSRLDQVLPLLAGGLSRSQLKNRMEILRVNGKDARFSLKVQAGDIVHYRLRPVAPLELVPEDIPLQVVFEDARVTVVAKPAGMVVHPGAGNTSGTLVQALLFRHPELGRNFGTAPLAEGEDGEDDGGDASPEDFRPGIVHRLDKDTSGIIITARDPETLAFLSRQFQERRTGKWYLALGEGRLQADHVRVQDFLCRDPARRQCFRHDAAKGKAADSTFHVICRGTRHTLCLVHIRTGRTHQIRIHARHLGIPLAGDVLYGKGQEEGRLMLHSLVLDICLPGEEIPRRFTAPVPEDFLGELERREIRPEVPLDGDLPERYPD